MSSSVASLAGGVGGGLALLAVVVVLLWFCKSKFGNSANQNSETGSSNLAALAEGRNRTRQFTLQELEQATKRFDEGNLIGFGSFGSVYKGLLGDGTVVAIKMRQGMLHPEFVSEVEYISEVRHRNLVNLLGYCIDDGLQMLVFEYLPNGSMCNHLYDTGQDSSTKLEFKQRISIAIGAARGLCHLHSHIPPLIHRNFKTANVLVDEDFIAKVADAGMARLLEKIDEAGSSQAAPSSGSPFLDPETRESRSFSETSDVYSFGVFLLELVAGVQAPQGESSSGTGQNLIEWAQSRQSLNELIDPRLSGTFTMEGLRDYIRLTILCLISPGTRRPKMDMVVFELERIQEKEMELTTVRGEGTSTITPGSELFKAQ
ncbi:hypothetical protein MLD38_036096 [Melastoma candidum]|uniref:Uncharacterized protein n=1 Tax=Melastoma candidum TaxID=119954 RepID=A0ACB9LIV0_9MYRT|nr:hypothetical protein MLD38_036096 [Melastoma candidum]